MLFWMRLLKLALPAARPHRSPSSRRQHSCPAPGPPAHPPPAEPAAAAAAGPSPGGAGGGGTSTAEPALPTTGTAAGSAPRWVTSSGAKPFIPGATAAAGGIPPRTKLPRRGAAARRGAPRSLPASLQRRHRGASSPWRAVSPRVAGRTLPASSGRPNPATTGAAAAEPRGPPHFLLPPLSCGDSSAVSYVTTATCRPAPPAAHAGCRARPHGKRSLCPGWRGCSARGTARRRERGRGIARGRTRCGSRCFYPRRAPLPFPPSLEAGPAAKAHASSSLFPIPAPPWQLRRGMWMWKGGPRRVSRVGAAAATAERVPALLATRGRRPPPPPAGSRRRLAVPQRLPLFTCSLSSVLAAAGTARAARSGSSISCLLSRPLPSLPRCLLSFPLTVGHGRQRLPLPGEDGRALCGAPTAPPAGGSSTGAAAQPPAVRLSAENKRSSGLC